MAGRLSQQRQAAADHMKPLIERELAEIGMGKAGFYARVATAMNDHEQEAVGGLGSLDRNGQDLVAFYIETNPGEEPKPLSRIASGGEISRIVLALKRILADNYAVATLLFDEVDTDGAFFACFFDSIAFF